jgi:hypothetical protein
MTESAYGADRPAADGAFGVLLVRKVAHTIDTSFGYRADRLPEVGEVIDVTDAAGNAIRAQVHGIERQKTLPIRATEFDGTTVGESDHPYLRDEPAAA